MVPRSPPAEDSSAGPRRQQSEVGKAPATQRVQLGRSKRPALVSVELARLELVSVTVARLALVRPELARRSVVERPPFGAARSFEYSKSSASKRTRQRSRQPRSVM